MKLLEGTLSLDYLRAHLPVSIHVTVPDTVKATHGHLFLSSHSEARLSTYFSLLLGLAFFLPRQKDFP